ncbi:hypothetical protein HK097_009827 [Rhizophlyctis rosea]|uniref:Uncharacterized protein n=1 Tax=Rhizophlyctis rosea TaxID=64517 RepID=A0AAD5S8D1_9FUNG|nr:hypothetical protein HK097_009827 [Rhizophlyctis rosea]
MAIAQWREALRKLVVDINDTVRKNTDYDSKKHTEDDETASDMQERAYGLLELIQERRCMDCVLDEVLLFDFPALYLAALGKEEGLAVEFLKETEARCEADEFLQIELLEEDEMVPKEGTLTEKISHLAKRLSSFRTRYHIC